MHIPSKFCNKVYRSFLKEQENFPLVSTAYTQSNRLASFFTLLFHCSLPFAVYSNFTPIPSCFHNHSKLHFILHCQSRHTLHSHHMLLLTFLIMTSWHLLIQLFSLGSISSIVRTVFYYEKQVFLTTHAGITWRAYINEQPLAFHCWTWYSHFTSNSLFNHVLSTSFARFEQINRLVTHFIYCSMTDLLQVMP